MQPNSEVSGWSHEGERVSQLRARIDELDNLITSLVKERFAICLQLGEIKEQLNLPVKNEARENEVMARVRSQADDPRIEEELINLYETILSSSKKLQSEQWSSQSNQSRVERSFSQTSGECTTRNKTVLPAARYFPQVTIIGLGLIGGALAALIKRHSPTTNIIGVDQKEVIDKAIADQVIDTGEEDALRAVSRSSLVLLAAPPSENMAVLRRLAKALNRGQLVVDVTSTKKAIVSLAENLDLNGADFIGGHPFFGSEQSGFDASKALKPEGSVFCLSPCASSSEMSLKRAIRWLTSLKLKPVITSAEDHDRLTASTSHIIQLFAVLLGARLSDGLSDKELADELSLSGPALRQMARLMESPCGMWSEIIAQNNEQISAAAKELASELFLSAEKIESGDDSYVKDRFDRARRTANAIRTT